MAKLTLTDITSGYASVDTLNSNFTAIETALENTLSRDGTTPNTMTADLDMNGHRLLNLVATQGEANFAWLGTWLPNTQYYQNNLVYAAEGTELGNGLICTKDHLSGATLNADMADPTKWDVYVQRGASVGGIAGPVSSTVNYIPQWSDTTGTTLKGGIPIGSGGVQAYDADLAAIAALATTAYGRNLLTVADEAALKGLVNIEPNIDVLAYVAPGTSGNILTSNGSVWTSTISSGFAVDQTWQDMTVSRAVDGTVYTNDTGKAITVSVRCNSNSQVNYSLYSGTSIIWVSKHLASDAISEAAYGIIPAGSTYKITVSAGTALNVTWMELR